VDRLATQHQHEEHEVWQAARAACERAREANARAGENLVKFTELRRARQTWAGRRADDARRRGRLTLQDLWLRYWALGGNADWLDLDGYLAGVVPLRAREQVVLLQALRERRFELAGCDAPEGGTG
jgi:hypothetical protein